jgi:hypothetical protein
MGEILDLAEALWTGAARESGLAPEEATGLVFDLQDKRGREVEK